jgi:hypothetical protein
VSLVTFDPFDDPDPDEEGRRARAERIAQELGLDGAELDVREADKRQKEIEYQQAMDRDERRVESKRREAQAQTLADELEEKERIKRRAEEIVRAREL